MEITNEIKAKVFAQYLGQVFVKEGVGIKYHVYGISFFGLVNIASEIPLSLDGIRAILKPLSAITDEDAIEVYKLLGWKDAEMRREYYGNDIFSDKRERWTFETSIKIYQFLQSKGYDIPQHLLGNKNLHEAGLAIYEAVGTH